MSASVALYIPAEHPAVLDPANHRQPVSGLCIESDKRVIGLFEGGWIDGPATIGAGWIVQVQEGAASTATKRPWYSPLYIARGLLLWFAIRGGIAIFEGFGEPWAAIVTGVIVAIAVLVIDHYEPEELP